MLMKGVLLSAFTVLLLSGCGVFQEKEVNCKEAPKEDCICIEIYQPVCGCNEVTYGNSCKAECMGIMDYTAGMPEVASR